MIRAVLALCMTLVPVQAAALSCVPQSVERSFQQASAAEESYLIVTGTLIFDETKLPKRDVAEPQGVSIPAHLEGAALGLRERKTAFDRKITLNVRCLASWCGNPASGQPVLAFLEKKGGSYELLSGPCGGYLIQNPKPAQLRKAERCLLGGACTPKH